MTRRRDSDLLKTKRLVVRLYTQLESISEQLSLFLGYPYQPEAWDKISASFDEDTVAIHQVTKDRHHIAEDIARFKAEKRSLRKLVLDGNASKSQIKTFELSKKNVANAISRMSETPDLGSSYADWEALPAEFKRQSAGHPRVTLQEMFVTTRSEMSLALSQVHAEEIKEGFSAEKLSTIDDIISESDSISINAGRKSLDGVVSDIEELERKKRTVMKLIEEIRNEEDEEVQKEGRGRRKRSKEQRLTEKTNLLIEIQEQISALESDLSGYDYAMRFKRVLERERRYAKEEGRKNDFRKVTKNLEYIESAMEQRERGQISDDKIKQYVDKAINSVDVTIESATSSLIEDVINEVSSSVENTEDMVSDNQDSDDILEVFDSMVLPKF